MLLYKLKRAGDAPVYLPYVMDATRKKRKWFLKLPDAPNRWAQFKSAHEAALCRARAIGQSSAQQEQAKAEARQLQWAQHDDATAMQLSRADALRQAQSEGLTLHGRGKCGVMPRRMPPPAPGLPHGAPH